MVDRNTRVKKKKFRKTPGAKTNVHYGKEKNSKATCAVTGKRLSGTGNQSKAIVKKLAKSKRRPSTKFGGVLSSEARKQVWENRALMETGKKGIEDVPMKLRKFMKEISEGGKE